jgi:hypothetical protein
MNIGTHTSHCCAKHGCKYSKADCPVATKTHQQEGSCEFCGSVKGIQEKLAELQEELAWSQHLESIGISMKYADGHQYM